MERTLDNRRLVYFTIGFILSLIGLIIIAITTTRIVGLTISEEPIKTTSNLAGVWSTVLGILVLSKARKRNKKGQAAMEFLMTYGWAMLAGIAAIGTLATVGIFEPEMQTAAVISPPFYSNAFSSLVNQNGRLAIKLELIQNLQETITIQNIEITVNGDQITETCPLLNPPPPVPLSSREKKIFTIRCTAGNFPVGKNIKGDIKIFYKRSGSQLEQIATGTITGKVG